MFWPPPLSPFRRSIAAKGRNTVASEPPEIHIGAKAHLWHDSTELSNPRSDHTDERSGTSSGPLIMSLLWPSPRSSGRRITLASPYRLSPHKESTPKAPNRWQPAFFPVFGWAPLSIDLPCEPMFHDVAVPPSRHLVSITLLLPPPVLLMCLVGRFDR